VQAGAEAPRTPVREREKRAVRTQESRSSRESEERELRKEKSYNSREAETRER